jgi:hypothetical protein
MGLVAVALGPHRLVICVARIDQRQRLTVRSSRVVPTLRVRANRVSRNAHYRVAFVIAEVFVGQDGGITALLAATVRLDPKVLHDARLRPAMTPVAARGAGGADRQIWRGVAADEEDDGCASRATITRTAWFRRRDDEWVSGRVLQARSVNVEKSREHQDAVQLWSGTHSGIRRPVTDDVCGVQ